MERSWGKIFQLLRAVRLASPGPLIPPHPYADGVNSGMPAVWWREGRVAV